MSAIHILNMSGTTICGRDQIRGYLQQVDYRRLAADGKIRMQVKTYVKHNCGQRDKCTCPRRKSTQSAICKECSGRD